MIATKHPTVAERIAEAETDVLIRVADQWGAVLDQLDGDPGPAGWLDYVTAERAQVIEELHRRYVDYPA